MWHAGPANKMIQKNEKGNWYFWKRFDVNQFSNGWEILGDGWQ